MEAGLSYKRIKIMRTESKFKRGQFVKVKDDAKQKLIPFYEEQIECINDGSFGHIGKVKRVAVPSEQNENYVIMEFKVIVSIPERCVEDAGISDEGNDTPSPNKIK